MGGVQSKPKYNFYITKISNPDLPLVPFLHTIIGYNGVSVSDVDPHMLRETLKSQDLCLEVLDILKDEKFTITIPQFKDMEKKLGINIIKLETQPPQIRMQVTAVKESSMSHLMVGDHILGIENAFVECEDELIFKVKSESKCKLVILRNGKGFVIEAEGQELGCEIGTGLIYSVPKIDYVMEHYTGNIQKVSSTNKDLNSPVAMASPQNDSSDPIHSNESSMNIQKEPEESSIKKPTVIDEKMVNDMNQDTTNKSQETMFNQNVTINLVENKSASDKTVEKLPRQVPEKLEDPIPQMETTKEIPNQVPEMPIIEKLEDPIPQMETTKEIPNQVPEMAIAHNVYRENNASMTNEKDNMHLDIAHCNMVVNKDEQIPQIIENHLPAMHSSCSIAVKNENSDKIFDMNQMQSTINEIPTVTQEEAVSPQEKVLPKIPNKPNTAFNVLKNNKTDSYIYKSPRATFGVQDAVDNTQSAAEKQDQINVTNENRIYEEAEVPNEKEYLSGEKTVECSNVATLHGTSFVCSNDFTIKDQSLLMKDNVFEQRKKEAEGDAQEKSKSIKELFGDGDDSLPFEDSDKGI
ncbi:hypothetical protein GINT2_001241 [Glugoides intestinalis]